MRKILIVEDEIEIAEIEKDYLEISGFTAAILNEGFSVMSVLQKEHYDLILLDVMLPGKSGYDICREIREAVQIPILMVTAKTEPVDRIRGLGLGADDYILKPFDPAELVARVKAHLAQYDRLTAHTGQDGSSPKETILCGELRILPKAYKAYLGNTEVHMATREFELLLFLAQNCNIVFTKEELFEKVWGYDYVGDASTVTVHINRIREKIEKDPKKPKYIETVWGVGYRLNKTGA